MNLRSTSLLGAEIDAHLKALGQLRISVFREWPYLYDGSMDYEIDYLKTYTQCNDSFCQMVYDGQQAIAATTALPMQAETIEFQQPLIDAGESVEDWFYFGESICLPQYRGHGIGVGFFEARLQHARALGYRKFCFCSVIRPEDHPHKPADYQPLDTFWHKRGFRPQPIWLASYRWQDIDQSTETEKQLRFWTRCE
ncbi:MAG: GNAT family N-acetyltransferase [Gammaproteobacteria bacterium]|nr:GNAT family N-acetyltransferase [Gammaproteobacteria bacterium]